MIWRLPLVPIQFNNSINLVLKMWCYSSEGSLTVKSYYISLITIYKSGGKTLQVTCSPDLKTFRKLVGEFYQQQAIPPVASRENQAIYLEVGYRLIWSLMKALVRVNFLPQEHNRVTLAMVTTQTSWSRVKFTNHYIATQSQYSLQICIAGKS